MSGPQSNCRVQGRMLHWSSGGSQIRNTVLVLASSLGFLAGWSLSPGFVSVSDLVANEEWGWQTEKPLAKHSKTSKFICKQGELVWHPSQLIHGIARLHNKHLCSALVFHTFPRRSLSWSLSFLERGAKWQSPWGIAECFAMFLAL